MIGRAQSRISQRKHRNLRLIIALILGISTVALMLSALGKLYADTQTGHDILPEHHLRYQPQQKNIIPPKKEQPPPPEKRAQKIPLPLMPPISVSVAPVQANALTLPQFDADISPLDITLVAPMPTAPLTTAQTHTVALGTPAQALTAINLQRFYPRRLRRLGITGDTRAHIEINAQGRVNAVTILSSTPAGRFDAAAEKAMRSIHYKPATDDTGQAIASTMTVTLLWRVE